MRQLSKVRSEHDGTAGLITRILVHRLHSDGSVRQTWDYVAGQMPVIPEWKAGIDHDTGNVQIEAEWTPLAPRSIRFDTQTKGRRKAGDRTAIVYNPGPIEGPYTFLHNIRMWPESITQDCWIVDCNSEDQYDFVPLHISVIPRALGDILYDEKGIAEILNGANAEAQRIKKEGEEKARKAFTEAYEEAIARAEQEAAQLVKSAKEDAVRETDGILQEAERQVGDMQAKARKNFDKAVGVVLGEVLS